MIDLPYSLSYSSFVHNRLIGGAIRQYRAGVVFSPVDTEEFQNLLCGGCPGCNLQPGTHFFRKPRTEGKMFPKRHKITLSTLGDTPAEVLDNMSRNNCVQRAEGLLQELTGRSEQSGLSR